MRSAIWQTAGGPHAQPAQITPRTLLPPSPSPIPMSPASPASRPARKRTGRKLWGSNGLHGKVLTGGLVVPEPDNRLGAASCRRDGEVSRSQGP